MSTELFFYPHLFLFKLKKVRWITESFLIKKQPEEQLQHVLLPIAVSYKKLWATSVGLTEKVFFVITDLIRDQDHRPAWVQGLKHFPLIQVLRFAMPGMTKKNRKKYDYFSRG